MKGANIITSIVLLLFGAYVIWDAIKMEYIIDNVPGPGFLPLWTGIFIIGLAFLMLYNNTLGNKPDSTKDPSFDKTFLRNVLVVIGSSTLAMVLVKVVGMLVAIGLLTGFLSWATGTKNMKVNAALTVVTPFIFWLVFEKALEVNFPNGLFGF
ncbi:MAG: hypothetical protein JG781_1777 [Peptococcaceae bacterium]|jgi:divalent metal cation (Fe/Co/Zn/Cd) transporter|nr:hypothetical protein [Peptococcaceae bacterium]